MATKQLSKNSKAGFGAIRKDCIKLEKALAKLTDPKSIGAVQTHSDYARRALSKMEATLGALRVNFASLEREAGQILDDKAAKKAARMEKELQEKAAKDAKKTTEQNKPAPLDPPMPTRSSVKKAAKTAAKSKKAASGKKPKAPKPVNGTMMPHPA